jgi:phenylacetate-CoA ligase
MRDKIIMKRPPLQEERYWNKTIETMPRKDLLEFQWEILKNQIKYVYERSILYRRSFEKAGVTPGDIKSIEDFRNKVPLGSKDDMRAYREESGDYFGGVVCVPLEELVTFGPSTGTSGQPTPTAVTREDLDFTTENIARQYWSFGLRPGDFSTCFAGVGHPGWEGLFLGFNKIGVPYIHLALGSVFQEMEVAKWIQMLQQLPVKSCYLPFSMFWTFREYIEEKGLSPKELLGKTKFVSTSGDLVTSTMRRVLENYWSIKLHELQISSDIMFGFYTCEARNGLHVPEDLFAIEVVDIKTGKPVPMGEPGYLIVTPTWQEGTCHLRWNTEDIVHISDEPCECGRTHARIWFHGRQAYVVNVRGQDILPHTVEDELLQVPEIEMKGFVCQLIKTSPETQDKLIVRTAYYEDKTKNLGELRGRAEERLKARFNVPVKVEFMLPQEAALVLHKVQRIVKRY